MTFRCKIITKQPSFKIRTLKSAKNRDYQKTDLSNRDPFAKRGILRGDYFAKGSESRRR
jgi:hypothetical protein